MRHARPLAIFAALTVAWTWPLAAHPGDAIPGLPGDNYSFLWDLWWFRTAFDTPGLSYFRTNYLFYPFGVDMVGQSHVALPGLVAATLLRPLTIVAAHNVLLFAFVFLNLACAYALAWDLTKQSRASIAGALVFGLSPYLGAHLIGHFELMAAWTLPLYVLLLRRALDGSRPSKASGAIWGAALTAVVAAYTTYYYLIYIGMLTVVLLAVRLTVVDVTIARRALTPALQRSRVALAMTMAALAALAVWIQATGGVDWTASLGISMTTPQNPLSAAWILALLLALCTWRTSVSLRATPSADIRRAAGLCAVLAVVFAAGVAPLLLETARIVSRGEYVSQSYSWRSAPRGVDLATLAVGPPSHPLVRDGMHRLYSRMHVDVVEAVGWLGVVPLLIALLALTDDDRAATREWWCVAGVFGVLALGPYLTVAGFDTGLRLPEILLRFVPIASNARMPGRMMAVVFVALSAIVAARISCARGRFASPGMQWLLIALVAFEYWDAPIPITLLDRPGAYEALRAQPAGAICEVPFGVGDGLSVGVGSRDRSFLYYATIHAHPIVGGVVSRMPKDTVERYERMAIVGDLLRLSSNRSAVAPEGITEPSPCTYLLVRDEALSPALRAYVDGLTRESIANDGHQELFRLRATR